MTSLPRLLRSPAAGGAARRRWDAAIRHNHYYSARRPMSSVARARWRREDRFLIPGFRPTAIMGDDSGFYSGSTFFEGEAPGPLPILDLAVILSPGPYCKQSAWLVSHQGRKGTKSGVDAAQRLVDGRRELMGVMRRELGQSSPREGVRRNIYAIMGHGVPSGLLVSLADTARGWLSSSVKMLFSNTPGAALLDQSRIRTVDARGGTARLRSLPIEWEYDFEMYMVVMDRMGSRLASLAASSFGIDADGDMDDHANVMAAINDATVGSGLVLTPSVLKRWDVTMMKGDALPTSLLPAAAGYPYGGGIAGEGRHAGERMAKLTLEWVRNSKDCWTVILRLQDDGPPPDAAAGNLCGGPSRDPVSLVFEGEYVAP